MKFAIGFLVCLLAAAALAISSTWNDKIKVQAQRASLQANVHRQQVQITSLQMDLVENKKALDSSLRNLEEKAAKLTETKGELEERKAEARHLQQSLEAKSQLAESLTQTVQTKNAEIEKNSKVAQVAKARLTELDRYGDSDPRHISASFIKTIEEREVDIAFNVDLTSTWETINPLPNYRFPPSKEQIMKSTFSQSFRHRKGVVLGARNHSVFILTALTDEESRFRVSSIAPTTFQFLPEGIFKKMWYSYTNTANEVSLSYRLNGALGRWDQRNATVLHAWKRGSMTLLVLGCEAPDVPSVETLPITGEKDWLTMVENEQLLYPISQLNGCVGLVPSKFDRGYDHRGKTVAWSGFAGSIHLVFQPIHLAPRPVIHSLILQLDSGNSFWTPARQEKQYMQAVSDQFDLSNVINPQIQIDGPIPFVGPVNFSDQDLQIRRKRLLESYRTILQRTEVF